MIKHTREPGRLVGTAVGTIPESAPSVSLSFLLSSLLRESNSGQSERMNGRAT